MFKTPKYQRGFLGDILSAGISGYFSAKSAKDRNKAQMAQAQAQMDFQERMSSTAHQREVVDLRAAGLNPILSATGGSGASTPGGAMANIEQEIGPAISSALQAANVTQNLKNMKAARKNIEADTKIKKEQRTLTENLNATEYFKQGKLAFDQKVSDMTYQTLQAQLTGHLLERDIDSGGLPRMNSIGSWTRILNRIIPSITAAGTGVAGFLIGKGKGGKPGLSGVKNPKYNPLR